MASGKTYQGVAGEALTQYLVCRKDGTAEKVFLFNEAATGILGLGVLTTTTAINGVCKFVFEGNAMVRAGGTIEPLDYVTVDGSTGKVVVATSADAIIGQWIPNLEGGANIANAASGDLIQIYVHADKSRLVA